MTKRQIIVIHFICWLCLSVIYFFLAESLVKYFFKGFHDVIVWIVFLVGGLAPIFVMPLISLIIGLFKNKKREKI